MAARKDAWDKTLIVFQILALIAVPTLTAYFGYQVQQAVTEQQVRRDYVQVAVGILSTRPIAKDDPLRPWAVEVINANSPVKLSETQQRALQIGAYVSKTGSEPPLQSVKLGPYKNPDPQKK